MAKTSESHEVPALIIAYEFALGLIELTLGFGIIALGRRVIEVYLLLRNNDFLNGQNDLLADILDKVIPYLTNHKLGIALLLLALGAVKITSAIGLWLGKEWGKHLLIWLLVVLIPVDLVGFLFHPSILDAGYLAIDIVIILYMIEFKPREYLEEVKGYFVKR